MAPQDPDHNNNARTVMDVPQDLLELIQALDEEVAEIAAACGLADLSTTTTPEGASR